MKNRSALILSLLAVCFSVSASRSISLEIISPTHKAISDTVSISGRYGIYTGIPKTYIGHFILHEDGTYQIALSSAEEKYATGTYQYHATTKSIEWTGGLCFTNHWNGKWEINKEGKQQIKLNNQTYALK